MDSSYITRELTLIAMTKTLETCLSLQIPRYRMEAYLKGGISLDDVERHDAEAMRRAIIHRDLMQIGRHERAAVKAYNWSHVKEG